MDRMHILTAEAQALLELGSGRLFDEVTRMLFEVNKAHYATLDDFLEALRALMWPPHSPELLFGPPPRIHRLPGSVRTSEGWFDVSPGSLSLNLHLMTSRMHIRAHVEMTFGGLEGLRKVRERCIEQTGNDSEIRAAIHKTVLAGELHFEQKLPRSVRRTIPKPWRKTADPPWWKFWG